MKILAAALIFSVSAVAFASNPCPILVPKIVEQSYNLARGMLIDAGYLPAMPLFAQGDQSIIRSEYRDIYGYAESIDCAGTGAAPCVFGFTDGQGRALLRVFTAGESPHAVVTGHRCDLNPKKRPDRNP